jgi:hypothetical protein
LNTPPDDMGGERSPIASTVPGLNETLSHEGKATSTLESAPAEVPPDPRQKRLLSKAGYRMRRFADSAFREAERQRVREW